MKNIKSPYMSIIGWGMFLTGALMFASCADDDIIESTAVTTGDAICFSASKTRSIWEPDQTRSASSKEKQTLRCEAADGDFSVDVTVEDGIRSYESSQQVHSRGTQISSVGGWSYKVGAYYFFDESVQDESGTSIDFFSENSSGGLKINTDNNKDNAAVTTSYYWPPVGEMKFFAVAPADVVEAPGATFKIPALENINTPTLTYTIPSNVADQKDIMVAQKTVTSQKNNTAVDLHFEHLLAAVQFKVGAMQFIKINSLKVVGVYGGEITFTCNNGVWTPSSTNIVDYDLTSVIEDTSGLTTGDEITGNTNNSIMLVAPQTLPDGAKIEVNYTETITDLEHTKTANLSGEWVAGKTTVYALNISGTDFGTVEIPRPKDQDAHYIMLPMSFNMGKILSQDKIVSVTATAQWKKDENGNDISGNTSSKTGISLKFQSDLTSTQSKGYWTDNLRRKTVKVSATGDKTESTLSAAENIRGGASLDIKNVEGEIVLFVEENNGTNPREGELIFTAKLISGTEIILGRGSFKQLCPSWNTSNVGVERIEENDEVHPYGFDYNRKVTFDNPGLTNYWVSKELRCIIEYYFANIPTAATGFVNVDYKEWNLIFFKVNYPIKVTLNYGALNTLKDVADTDNGLTNSSGLYAFTGSTSVNSIETTLKESWGEPSSETGDADVPDDYAAFIALCKNRMYEIEITTESDTEGSRKDTITSLYQDANNNVIIEWYLPSSAEAESLLETGGTTEGDVVSKLDGIYWSSTAGSDTDAYAHSFKYENNTLDKTFGTNGVNTVQPRMDELKVRAVRKKPTTTN